MSDSAYFVEQLKSGYDKRTGRVHVKKYGRLPVAPDITNRRRGYIKLSDYREGCSYHAPTHVVVWEFFNGPVPDGKEIHHINGIRQDNRIQNLAAVTHSENVIEGLKLKKVFKKKEKEWWQRWG